MEEMKALLQKEHCQFLAAMRLRWYHIMSPLQGAFSHVKAFPTKLRVSSAISGQVGCKLFAIRFASSTEVLDIAVPVASSVTARTAMSSSYMSHGLTANSGMQVACWLSHTATSKAIGTFSLLASSSSAWSMHGPDGKCVPLLVAQGTELVETMAINAGQKPDAEVVSAAVAEASAANSSKLELIDLEAIAGPRYTA